TLSYISLIEYITYRQCIVDQAVPKNCSPFPPRQRSRRLHTERRGPVPFDPPGSQNRIPPLQKLGKEQKVGCLTDSALRSHGSNLVLTEEGVVFSSFLFQRIHR